MNQIPGYSSLTEFAEEWGIRLSTVSNQMKRGLCAYPPNFKPMHPLYKTWVNMKNRCYNDKSPQFKYWGGRGIGVCNRWKNSFECFILDMGPKPDRSYSLDRINSDLDYSPENCKWSTKREQVLNRRKYYTNQAIPIGEFKSLTEFANYYGIHPKTVSRHIKQGYCPWNPK